MYSLLCVVLVLLPAASSQETSPTSAEDLTSLVQSKTSVQKASPTKLGHAKEGDADHLCNDEEKDLKTILLQERTSDEGKVNLQSVRVHEQEVPEQTGPTLQSLTAAASKDIKVPEGQAPLSRAKLIGVVGSAFLLAWISLGAVYYWTRRERAANTRSDKVLEEAKFFLLQPSSGRTIASSSWRVNHYPGGVTVRHVDEQRSVDDAQAFFWKDDISNIGFAQDTRFSLGVGNEKFQEGNCAHLWHNPANGFCTEFVKNADNTISVKDKAELVLGFGPCYMPEMAARMGESRVILVKKNDEQRLLFAPWESKAAKKNSSKDEDDCSTTASTARSSNN